MSTLAPPPIDLFHLDRYTGGDGALNAEVLRLFETQCRAMVGDLETAAGLGDQQAWRQLTHTLKGAARGVGAGMLADLAADAEKVDVADRLAAGRMTKRICEAAHEVELFVARFATEVA